MANIAKKASAAGVVHDLLQIPQISQKPLVLGIGSGSTIVPFVSLLKEKMLKSGPWESVKLRVVCIPTSWQAKDLITQADLQLGDLSQFPTIDLDVDGADEVDANLNCIKGGGACQLQEKMVAFNSKNFVIVADESKDSAVLGTKVSSPHLP
jgi:ribose 5-phosphate isomerase A